METKFGHVVPLLLFTSLAIIAAGLVTSLHFYNHSVQTQFAILVIAAVCAFVGGALSFLHLGKKGRAPRAVAGIAHSWLSREIMLLGLFVVALVGYLIALNTQMIEYIPALTSIATAAGLVLCFTIGMVYNLDAQLAWRGLLNLVQPVLGALVLAVVFNPFGGPLEINYMIFVLVDVLFALLRQRQLRRLSIKKEAILFTEQYRYIPVAWFIRYLAIIVVAITIYLGFVFIAAISAAVMILTDRFILYASAMQLTPKCKLETERAERMQKASNDLQ